MNKFSAFFRLSGPVLCALGIASTIAACGVLASHARTFGLKRDTAVMVGTQLPELKAEVALLEASVQAQEMFSAQALSAREEQAAVFVLPVGAATARAASAIRETAAAFTDAPVTVQSVNFGPLEEPEDTKGEYKTRKGTVILKGSLQSVSRVLAVLGYGGQMMVRDVLSPDVQQAFLREVESVSPLSLKTAEDFLYLDLASYAADPDREEERILEDAAPEIRAQVLTHLLLSGLAEARTLLGTAAPRLTEKDLWPLPLLKIESLQRDGDVWIAELTLFGR